MSSNAFEVLPHVPSMVMHAPQMPPIAPTQMSYTQAPMFPKVFEIPPQIPSMVMQAYHMPPVAPPHALRMSTMTDTQAFMFPKAFKIPLPDIPSMAMQTPQMPLMSASETSKILQVQGMILSTIYYDFT